MKKFLEEKHDLLAGVFAVLALVSIVCEIAFSGFTAEGIISGVKDISGILIDVLVLAVAASVLIRRPSNFKEKFTKAMEDLNEKYEPLLVEDKKDGVIRYKIASNSDALFSRTAKGPERLFELDEKDPAEIRFYINKSFFNQKGGTDFDGEKLANQIALRLSSLSIYKNYKITTFPNGENYGVKIDFKRMLNSNDDIDTLISLIDYTILLFVARNKS